MKESIIDWTIKDIVDKYPETLDVFIKNGFEMFGRENAIEELGAILRLKTALRTKNMNGDSFLRLLEEAIGDTAREQKLLSTVVVNNPGRAFNFVAQLPCPLKVPLQRELQAFMQKYQEETNSKLNYYTGSCCQDVLDFSDCIQHYKEVDEIPDLILANGFNLFQENFIKRFVSQGIYQLASERLVDEDMAKTGILDADGHYTVIAGNITVMVVDRKRLNGLTMPRSWNDLLKPEYEGKVILNSYGDEFSDIVLLNIYKEHGIEGINALGRAVVDGSHPSKMIKGLASSRNDLPPIYIMSHFFAKTISTPADIEIIWPEEGALVTPLYLLVKADKAQEFKGLIDYLTGPEIGQICAGAFFPSVNPEVNNNLSPQMKFKWVGWEFVKQHDIKGLLKELNDTFLLSHRATTTGKTIRPLGNKKPSPKCAREESSCS